MLKYASPSYLFLPFLILYLYRLAAMRWGRARIQSTRLQVLITVISFVSATFTVIPYLHSRSEFIEGQKRFGVQLTEAFDKFEAIAKPHTRIAFWIGSCSKMSFHFLANSWYANDYFDKELLEKYPRYAYFRLHDVVRLIEKRRRPYKAPSALTDERCHVLADSPLLCSLWSLWKKFFPVPDIVYRTDELVSGERYGIKVSVIVFRKRELTYELTKVSFEELLSLIQSRFGRPKVQEVNIAGIDWVLISVPGRAGLGPLREN